MSHPEDGWYFVEARHGLAFEGVQCGYVQGGVVTVAGPDIDGMPSARGYSVDNIDLLARVHIPTPSRWRRPTDALSHLVPFDFRSHRANALTSFVLSIIAKYLDNDVDRERNTIKHVAQDLMDVFHANGFEPISDQDRAVMGMPPRGALGMTDDEYRIMEARRIMEWAKPLPCVTIQRDSPLGEKD